MKKMAALAAMAIAFLSCGAPEKSHILPTPMAAHQISAEDSLRYNYFFLEAIRQQNAGRFDAAYDLLRHSIDINPAAPEGWFYLSMYQSELGQDSLAMVSLEKAATLNPANDTYQERLAQYYLSTNQLDRAKSVYERLASNNHNRIDVLNILIHLYQQDKDYDGMLRAISRIEEIEGQREEITLSKMRVYELKGDQASAWKALKSLSDKHPSDVNYRVMMGNWLMQNNREKEAQKIFAAALKEEPENVYVQSSMYDYYRTTGQDLLARQMMLNIIVSPKASTESKATMMRQAIQENQDAHGDSTEILNLFNQILAVNPRDSDMSEMKVAYMTLKKMPEDSINIALRDLLEISPENVGARTQLLGFYLKEMDWDNVVDICHNGSLYNPEELVFYYYEGLAYYQQKKHEEAFEAFRRGVGQVNRQSNREVVADLYYFMGDILYQKDSRQEAFAAYDSCLQWKKDHISCLNNYAYYLSVKGEDLRKAEQMSYQTVKEEPGNVTYLDTYAWILFMQERYAEAKIYIDQALTQELDENNEETPNPVIIEHAGDIYSMNGEEEKAVDYWQLAIDYGSEQSDLIREKIRTRRYIPE